MSKVKWLVTMDLVRNKVLGTSGFFIKDFVVMIPETKSYFSNTLMVLKAYKRRYFLSKEV